MTVTCQQAPQVMHVYQGDDYAGVVTVYRPDGYARPPADLTGYTAACQIRRRPPADTTVVAEVECVVSVPDHTVLLSMTGAVTATLPVEALEWDLEMTSPDGYVTTVCPRSPVRVEREVTRP